MSCFGGVEMTMRGSGSSRPWRWWRAKCAGIAASVGSRLRRSIKGLDGHRRRQRRRRGATASEMHRRSFAPVYVDELYAHHHDLQPSSKPPLLKLNAVAAAQEELVGAAAGAGRASGKATARVAAATTTTAAANNAAAGGARTGGGKPRAAVAGVGAMRNILMRSPGRGGGGVLGVVKGMGEVDLRAELFIRKFKEDMRLQSQRSAEEFQAMLARGL
ncbi:hypothetical protein QOZ80_8BG0643530 [Eleusine coracana subsp. coracana]|nr:hypothetical protein QOZ80_8BG0643530 [Eleusine coracana subsp. coracana]